MRSGIVHHKSDRNHVSYPQLTATTMITRGDTEVLARTPAGIDYKMRVKQSKTFGVNLRHIGLKKVNFREITGKVRIMPVVVEKLLYVLKYELVLAFNRFNDYTLLLLSYRVQHLHLCTVNLHAFIQLYITIE